ncbi:MAG: rRNA maturation RNase YbeY [Planctomycetota bacterium]|nr:rRNA maturation RNase YbeY [Planctomycetota bacterium]MDE2216098.1 rRNA maturation RNase YbeY [Planctomycetota bacterium]
MKLEIIDLQKFQPIDKNKIKKIIKGILKVEKKDAELSIVFIDNKTIKQINRAFLGHNYATDVLSFTYDEPSFKNNVKGEIVVSVEMASKLSRRYGYEVEGEIVLYLVHGLLHLLGYDDKRKKDAKKMHQRAGELLLSFGYRDVYIPN